MRIAIDLTKKEGCEYFDAYFLSSKDYESMAYFVLGGGSIIDAAISMAEQLTINPCVDENEYDLYIDEPLAAKRYEASFISYIKNGYDSSFLCNVINENPSIINYIKDIEGDNGSFVRLISFEGVFFGVMNTEDNVIIAKGENREVVEENIKKYLENES